MTTITIDRALLEQTLQALVRTYHYGGVIAADAECITALRAVLAQQAEPVAWVGDPSTQDYASTVPDPQIEDRLARHGIPMPGDPK